ncbi:MAG: hypothetical protein EKK54_02525 [Neisseriaceae bacterium]|nr:MAG: hypothetical protein EKK54_02525 [Neisseriaceae bacterium]
MIKRILILFALFSACISANALQLTADEKLTLQAESYIASRPAESTMSILEVFNNYQRLQQRWIGQDNAGYNQIVIATNPLFAKTQLFNRQNLAESEGKITFVRLNYTTNALPNSPQNVSGLLILPPTKSPKGVILFFHSTISGKLNVPSLHFEDYKAQMLAAIFAANGYMVVSPDYIGLGRNFAIPHPYILYPRYNVSDGRDMLVATHEYLQAKKLLLPLDNKTILPLFVSGYSEGASYALWFSRIYQSEPDFAKTVTQLGLKLRKTVPIDGAYNLSGVMFPFLLTSQVNDSNNAFQIQSSFWGSLLKPSLLTNVSLAFAYYNQRSINSFLNPDFFHGECSIIPTKWCRASDFSSANINDLLFTPSKTMTLVLKLFWAAIWKSSSGVIYSPLFNSVAPLMRDGAASDHELLAQASQADILNWQSHNPITLISLAHDSLVPEQNSADAYNGMIHANSTNLKYIKLANSQLHARALFGANVVDHVSFELYALLIALNEFEDSQP